MTLELGFTYFPHSRYLPYVLCRKVDQYLKNKMLQSYPYYQINEAHISHNDGV